METENGQPFVYIDLFLTGIHLKYLLEKRGYTVRDVQEELSLACPQSVYRWLKGEILPSVDNLLRLSRMLQVRMDELLIVKRSAEPAIRRSDRVKRQIIYQSRLAFLKMPCYYFNK